MAEWLHPLATPIATRFYQSCGQKGPARRDERIAVERRDGELVAAVRLSPREDQWLVRALLVAPAYRDQGLARSLMHFVLAELDHPLWCFVRPELADFYRKLGFVDWPDAQIPKPILGPLMAYRRHQSLLGLRYPGTPD